jgi:hypothetical protein
VDVLAETSLWVGEASVSLKLKEKFERGLDIIAFVKCLFFLERDSPVRMQEGIQRDVCSLLIFCGP